MDKKRRFTITFALIGFLVAAGLFARLEVTNYKPFQTKAAVVAIVLCPASLLSASFLDIEPHSAEALIGWLLIAFANSGIYGLIGYVLGRRLQQAD